MRDTEKGRTAGRHTTMRDGKSKKGRSGREGWRDKGCGTLRIGGKEEMTI